MRTMIAALLAAGLVPCGTAAQGVGNAAFDLSAGTTGISGHAQVGLHERLAIRASYNWLDFAADDQEQGGIVYDGDLEFSGFGGFLDVHPMAGGFTLTGGVYVGDKSVQLDALPQETVDIGGRDFAPDEIGMLQGAARFSDTAFFAGLGWDDALYKEGRLSFNLRAGVMFAGEPDVSLGSTRLDEIEASGALANEAVELRARLDAEERELEEDIDDYAYWPVLTVGLGYRF